MRRDDSDMSNFPPLLYSHVGRSVHVVRLGEMCMRVCVCVCFVQLKRVVMCAMMRDACRDKMSSFTGGCCACRLDVYPFLLQVLVSLCYSIRCHPSITTGSGSKRTARRAQMSRRGRRGTKGVRRSRWACWGGW